jgi:hypothetical protein
MCADTAQRKLEGLRQLVCERAAGSLFPIASCTTAAIGTLIGSTRSIDGGSGDGASCSGSIFAFGRLSGIRTQEAIFEGSAIEATNDGLHLVVGGRFNECEALGFLGFVVSDHLNGVGDEIFG